MNYHQRFCAAWSWLLAVMLYTYVDCCLRIVHSVVGEPATVILVRESQIVKKHWILARLSWSFRIPLELSLV